MAVHERFYPDDSGNMVQKWKLNKTTARLVFSQRWVLGLLERHQKDTAGAGGVGSGVLGGLVMDGGDLEGDEESDSSDDDEEE